MAELLSLFFCAGLIGLVASRQNTLKDAVLATGFFVGLGAIVSLYLYRATGYYLQPLYSGAGAMLLILAARAALRFVISNMSFKYRNWLMEKATGKKRQERPLSNGDGTWEWYY